MSSRQLTEFSGVCMSVEHAFGIQKMKFKILRDPIEYGETEKNIRIVKSCIWLNNFIIDNNHQHELISYLVLLWLKAIMHL